MVNLKASLYIFGKFHSFNENTCVICVCLRVYCVLSHLVSQVTASIHVNLTSLLYNCGGHWPRSLRSIVSLCFLYLFISCQLLPCLFFHPCTCMNTIFIVTVIPTQCQLTIIGKPTEEHSRNH